MPTLDRRTALCARAVAVARRIEDRNALAFALNAQHVAVWGPDNQAGRIAIATELAQLAWRSGDRHLVFQAHFWRANDALELGDFGAFDTDLATCARLAGELRQPYHLFHLELFQAARAAILGRFEDAQRLAAAAYASGMKWHETAAAQFSSTHALNLALLTGEPLDGFVPFMEAAIAQHLEVPGLRSFLARIYTELEREAPARREFNQLAAAHFSDLPRDGNLLPTLAFLSATCAFLGDTERATILYGLLKPYADRAAVITNICAYFGCGSHYLGMLAVTMSHWDDAVRHLQDAIAFNTRMHARPHLALTQHAYAHALLSRAQPGDREAASSLMAAALDTAHELGMKRLEEKVSGLLESTQPSPISDQKPATRHQQTDTAIFHREGQYWTLAYAGTEIRLKDNKGMQHLAHLLRHPGQELLAFDLIDFGVRNAERGTLGASPPASGTPALDAQAKAEYKERLRDLREELGEAQRFNDLGRVEKIQGEMQFLSAQLSAAVGLHGKDRKAGAVAERARLVITKRIKVALKTIARFHPTLAHHLRACVKTGYYCSYTPPPDQPVAWKL